MKIRKKNKSFERSMAASQILILLVGIVAFSYGVGFVSGQEETSQEQEQITPSVSDEIILGGNRGQSDLLPSQDIGLSSSLGLGKVALDLATSGGNVGAEGAAAGGLDPHADYYDNFKSGNVGAEGAAAGAGGFFNLGSFWGNVVMGAIVAAGSYVLISVLEGAGLINENWAGALKPAVAVGSFAGFTIAGALGNGGGAILAGAGIGLGVAVVIFALAYEENDQLIVNFQCIPWQSPSGGERCDECGKDGLPCSEYRCRSLGLGCELLNEEGENALCEHVTRDDITPPEIRPWQGALSVNYFYENDDAVSPPDRGTIISRDNGNSSTDDSCVPPFESVSFGIALDEPAVCKIDTTRKLFDEMRFTLSNGIYKYNHSTSLNVPGKEVLQEGGIDVENGENMSFYMACKDRNGNANKATFVYTTCISNLPDTTPPRVVSTSMANGVPVASGLENAELEIYTNEPVTACKWDRQDLAYPDMENAMTCSQTINNRGLYTCMATLTGIDEEVENDYYFRCEDKQGNVNQESFKFTLEGTRPLTMDYLKINNQSDGARIKGSTNSVRVTFTAATSQGHDYGAANCHYARYRNLNGRETRDEYRPFSGGSSWTESHRHEDFLAEGQYKYSVRCIDLAGNFDSENVSFYVESDTDAPVIARAYEEDGNLKLITSEAAKCVYSKQDGDDPCNYAFDDGIRTSTLRDEEFSEQHFITWDLNSNFYLKCQDEHNNLPAPDRCSSIIRTYAN